MRINSLNRIESSTRVLAYPSSLMSKFDSREKQFFIKLCLTLGITNDTEFEKIPVSSFKRNSFRKLLDQYGEYFVVVGVTNDGLPWYSLYDQKQHRQIVLPHNSISFTKLLSNTDVVYVAHSNKELANRVAQQKAERLINQEYEFYYGRNKIDKWTQKYLDKSGYSTRSGRVKEYSSDYGLNEAQNIKYFEIIEKNPEGKLESLRAQYTKYLNTAVQNAISNGFDEKSLLKLEKIASIGRGYDGSEFSKIEQALKVDKPQRAAEYMVDLQIKLERYKLGK